MRFKVQSMSRGAAQAITSWQYEKPYDFYNRKATQKTIDWLLNGSYYAVYDETGELVGYYCFGKGAQVPGGNPAGAYAATDAIDIGLGMKPELTGTGMGLAFTQAGVEYAVKHFAPAAIRLSVTTFNKRAIKVYERAGFYTDKVFMSMTPDGEKEFQSMLKIVASRGGHIAENKRLNSRPG